jgi:hypothetical protein
MCAWVQCSIAAHKFSLEANEEADSQQLLRCLANVASTTDRRRQLGHDGAASFDFFFFLVC